MFQIIVKKKKLDVLLDSKIRSYIHTITIIFRSELYDFHLDDRKSLQKLYRLGINNISSRENEHTAILISPRVNGFFFVLCQYSIVLYSHSTYLISRFFSHNTIHYTIRVCISYSIYTFCSTYTSNLNLFLIIYINVHKSKIVFIPD